MLFSKIFFFDLFDDAKNLQRETEKESKRDCKNEKAMGVLI